MWQRFNESSRAAILRAQKEASRDWQAEAVETQHLWVALLAEENSSLAIILKNLGVSKNDETTEVTIKPVDFLPPAEIHEISGEFGVDDELVRQIESRLLRKLRGKSDEPKLSENVKRVLELAADEAREIHNLLQGSTEIGSEHLLIGLLRLEDAATQEMLDYHLLELETTRTAVIEYLRIQEN